MNLIVIHKNNNYTARSGKNLLQFAISSQPIAAVIFEGLSRNLCGDGFTLAIPEEWVTKPTRRGQRILPYAENVPISPELLRRIKRHPWFIVSNGRFATQVNTELLAKVLAAIHTDTDIVAVDVEPELLTGRENVRLTTHGRVAGIRRLYCDCAELVSVPDDWPSHIFIKTQILSQVLTDRTPSTSPGMVSLSNHLPQSFSDFLEKCKERALILRSIRIGGSILDLETEYGLLNFCRKMVGLLPRRYFRIDDRKISASKEPRLVGQVLLGKNVEISPGVIVIGPAIISDNVRIGQDAVINSSIVGPEVRVPQNQLVDNCIVKEPQGDWNHLTNRKSNLNPSCRRQVGETTSRIWPGFSYAGCFKRLADCFTAIVVLILFAPIIPFIAIAIKLSSPGAVFFKDKRQGLHGRFFNCLKFRTMLAGADKIQDKLRAISQVDGPQFKIQDDPRLSAVGRFLRDTYIDEIPQFINVLLGQMSVVGPRPSPESENTLCPSWRDARLSVRPGITGLWQVCRTRRPMQDFQEWIYYDVKYVKNLSLRMDLWICRQTAKKMFGNFIRQF